MQFCRPARRRPGGLYTFRSRQSLSRCTSEHMVDWLCVDRTDSGAFSVNAMKKSYIFHTFLSVCGLKLSIILCMPKSGHYLSFDPSPSHVIPVLTPTEKKVSTDPRHGSTRIVGSFRVVLRAEPTLPTSTPPPLGGLTQPGRGASMN